ncbi:dipeptidyl aminopeptidase BI isoform X1 [Rhodamnia argentea]|uniref:Prolyl endopeptidase n=1 Tax=Rhodamnia argentea TaxID=178133 RepID=A0ABM3HI16_9MYRT|nr:dipeptidyl aminopeptidase BI isoform X1 [Rhodamnia argentea]XP_048136249.1 dipeptidyl aminopeptidase BI isoform X1 [Rhodamnia argentea]
MAFPSIRPTRASLVLTITRSCRQRFMSAVCKETSFALPRPPPPVPKRVPFAVSAHGRTWQDPFHWMSDVDDPEFVEHLRRENSYAQAFMADTRELQTQLVSEMKSRVPADIRTPPERWGPWLYYQFIPEGKEFPVLCRRLEAEKGWAEAILSYVRGQQGREQVLLDWNEIAERHGYVHVGMCRVSPDHRFLAYTVDTNASEWFKLQVKDIERGCMLPNIQVEGVVSVAWAKDGSTLFYTLSDEHQRPYRILCTKLRSSNLENAVIFTERDSKYCVDITGTKDGKFITLNSSSRNSSEVYVIDAENPLGGLRRICKRVSDVRFFVEHHCGSFYILTNAPLCECVEWNGHGYYLARSMVEDPELGKFQNVILPGASMTIEDMDVFNGHLVLSIDKQGEPMLCSINLPINVNSEHAVTLEHLNPWFFPVPSNFCSILPGSNHDFTSQAYRAVLSSPVMPDVVVEYDMSRRTFSTIQQEEVRCVSADIGSSTTDYVKNFVSPINVENMKGEPDENSAMQGWKDFSDVYCCERKDVISHDGVRIPLTILYSKTLWQKGKCPGLLHGYGAYGEVLDISWCPNRLSLLNRGWVVAFADASRGGGGVNSMWHTSGRGAYKQNSIHDFASCAKYLVHEGYVRDDQLCSMGHSAGCLLVGAAINMYPGLFHAAIMKVPFLDICNTLSDPTMPLSILDHEEFGDPRILPQFESIMSYAPYDNIREGGCHPSTLVSASFLDSRVGVWEAAKWVAKVREVGCTRCSHSVILRTNMSAGHFGEGGHYRHLKETAFDYAFLMKVTGAFNK